MLERTRRNIGPRAWQALYQGDPTPDEGVYFERAWLHRAPLPPADQMRFYGASDYAVTDAGGDYTVHVVVGIDPIGRMWVVDIWRKQTAPDRWIPPLLDMMRRWTPIRWAEEAGQIEKSIGPFLLRAQHDEKVWTQRLQFTSATDKPTRARSIQGRVALRGLWFPHDALWVDQVEQELLKFPNAAHDDIVDALSLVGRMVAGLEHGKLPDAPPRTFKEGEMTLDQLVDLEERRQHWMG